ncbi:hypothetical protein [Spirillospora albida]|uniref:hypothetical protein n=1 Tax=Spirillospora albida TaxID=58123 RepID=UPI0004BF98C2|nr:hypothetical protein [Spirillospora albida]
MRRSVTATIISGALAAGLLVSAPAAQADTRSKVQPSAAQDDFGKEVTVTRTGAISAEALLAEAKRAGKPYSAKETAAIRAAERCGWYERTRGRKSAKGRWLIMVTNRLNWCWDGSYVRSYRADFRAYTYNKHVWQWRGWAKRKATHPASWSSVTARVRGKFYYTGNGRTYKPWVAVTGYNNGAYRSRAGG